MDVVGSDGKPIDITTDNLQTVFPKRVEASVIVSPSVYVSGQGFGVTWRVALARVSPPQKLTAAMAFADEIDEEVRPKQEETAEEERPATPPQVEEETPTAPPVVPVKNRRRVVGST